VYRELTREAMAPLADAVLWWRTPTAGGGIASEAGVGSETRVQRVVPDGCLDVIWSDGVVFVAGPDTRAHLAPAGAGYVGLRFTAGSGPAALGVPAAELRDTRVPADALWSPARVRAWAEALRARSPAALARLARGPADPVTRAVWRALRTGGRVDATAHAIGLSARQLHRRCLVSFGYGPKTLGRILRFDRAVALARTGAGLADVAAATGYADQAHLCREVRDLAGVPLTELLGGSGEAHRAAKRSTPLPSGSWSTA
jgi:AraC-like DNA-binding protein